MQIKQDYLQQVCDRLTSYRNVFQKELTELELAEISLLKEKLDKNAIAIAVFGMVSRGKTSLLNALLGQKLGKTEAIHGTTQNISIYEWDAGKKVQLRLIDTPGIDEVNGELQSELALEAAKQADLILFVIVGDMTRLEQEAIAQLQTFYKPILLVFNKTDLYPESDRLAIHAALQNEEVRKLISPQEIVLTVAEPKPVKVRIQYSDAQESQEIWEQPKPEVQALKERILALLNTEGEALIAVNVLRSLFEIQKVVTQRHLQKLQASTAIVALVFVSEAIVLLLSPSQWIDGGISVSFSGILALWVIGKYPAQKKYLWIVLIVAISCLSGGLGINSEIARYIQIVWTGLSLYLLFNSITNDIDRSWEYGKFGAKKLMEEIIESGSDNSILRRFQNFPSRKENLKDSKTSKNS